MWVYAERTRTLTHVGSRFGKNARRMWPLAKVVRGVSKLYNRTARVQVRIRGCVRPRVLL